MDGSRRVGRQAPSTSGNGQGRVRCGDRENGSHGKQRSAILDSWVYGWTARQDGQHRGGQSAQTGRGQNSESKEKKKHKKGLSQPEPARRGAEETADKDPPPTIRQPARSVALPRCYCCADFSHHRLLSTPAACHLPPPGRSPTLLSTLVRSRSLSLSSRGVDGTRDFRGAGFGPISDRPFPKAVSCTQKSPQTSFFFLPLLCSLQLMPLRDAASSLVARCCCCRRRHCRCRASLA